jgi:hypothetical protein
LFEEIDHLGNT